MPFCDVSFAGDSKDSKFTSASLLCLFGSRTFCPVTWLLQEQIARPRSSAEAERIASDSGSCMDRLRAMGLWKSVVHVLELQIEEQRDVVADQESACVKETVLLPIETQELSEIDHVPPNVPKLSKRCELVIMTTVMQ